MTTNPASNPLAQGDRGPLIVRPARPRLTPTGTRAARLRRRMVAAALANADESAEALRWLWDQRTKAKSPRERRLCVATALQHMREMAKAGVDEAVEASSRVLVIAPDDIRRILLGGAGVEDPITALERLAAPAPNNGTGASTTESA